MRSEAFPSRRKGVLDYQLAGEVVVYDPTTSQAASLNETAGLIWQLCDGTRTMETVCLEMAQHFDQSADEVDRSVREAVEQLCNLGLLCVV